MSDEKQEPPAASTIDSLVSPLARPINFRWIGWPLAVWLGVVLLFADEIADYVFGYRPGSDRGFIKMAVFFGSWCCGKLIQTVLGEINSPDEVRF